MTDTQFQTLARYEDNLRQAQGGRWARHPGRTAIQSIYKTLTELAGPQPRLQPFCAPCVLRVLKEAGKLYFAEKEARDAAQAAPKVQAEETPSKPKRVAENTAQAAKRASRKSNAKKQETKE